ncbi:MAG TPA: SGNH/GDSL hydrolase family protein [Micavibrio sp.]|nr:SGNH/GDSL hydrolase family protein [Micavibrio sp.]
MAQSVFEKHPRLVLLGFIFAVVGLLAIMAEIGLRYVTPYNIGYYTAVLKEGAYRYPYGDIKINRDGYPDDDFDLSGTKTRIGYLGDSIIMGVGAGDGYRISDLLQSRYPNDDHWTFGVMGNGLREDEMFELVDKYKLDKIIYGFNLNDFLPPLRKNGQPIAGPKQSALERIVHAVERFVSRNVDGLRGKSYLYTVLRTGAKNILQQFGFGHTGFKSAELFPREHEELIRDTAERFNAAARRLSEKNIELCLIVFPYEMQISKEAAAAYRDKGIGWENGFEEGSTQTLFKKYLDLPHVYDGRDAFKDLPDSPPGTYFVYNRGDKIDFNHLNRRGHAVLTNGLIASKICDF